MLHPIRSCTLVKSLSLEDVFKPINLLIFILIRAADRQALNLILHEKLIFRVCSCLSVFPYLIFREWLFNVCYTKGCILSRNLLWYQNITLVFVVEFIPFWVTLQAKNRTFIAIWSRFWCEESGTWAYNTVQTKKIWNESSRWCDDAVSDVRCWAK